MRAFAQRFLPWIFFRATIAQLTYCNSRKVGPVIGARDNMCRICCFKETLFEGSRLEEMLLDTSDCCILAGEFTHALRHTFVMPWGPAKFPTLPQTIPYIQPNAIC